MSKIHAVPADWAANAHIDAKTYAEKYRRSIEEPEAFWREESDRLDWIKPWTRLGKSSFNEADFGIEWFPDGVLNVSYNCVDRHLEKFGDAAAIIWEGDDPSKSLIVTYKMLHEEVCRFANALKSLGVGKGDRVTIYMPMIPLAAIGMLACTRIGAIHSVVFAGFSPEALAGRIQDCDSKVVITADGGMRGGKFIPLKDNVDEAVAHCPCVESVLIVKNVGNPVTLQAPRDYWYHSQRTISKECEPEPMNADDPMFILYTSGSTGKPKGVMHTTGGYLTWAAMTHKYVFDHRDDDVFWCAADIGWVTGHTYSLYGPLANGATTVMFEGVPSYPDHSRFWQIIDKYEISTFYGAPTALRALMREGDEWVKKTSRKSLRLLGSVGEPINPEAWEWYYRVVGEERCPVVDTWWQTETGGAMIAPMPGAMDLKPGSATRPMFGVVPQLVDNEGAVIEGAGEGNLCLTQSWPGQMRGVWNDAERFFQTYFTSYPGKYFTGDGCKRDEDGDYWITGRVDDVINVSGHRMGTAEIESALVAHGKVAEAAVVGMPHDIKGQGIYAYVTLNASEAESEDVRAELIQWVRHEIGPIATPDVIHFAPALPKTRSGKIMRRILRKIAEGDTGNLGDTSTLADPGVVEALLAGGR